MPTVQLPRSTQVVVVGGGPAGSATAWYCATAGLDVVLLDRAHFPRAKPCAEYVSPEGARILAAMGALDAIEARSAALTGMVVHAPSGARIHGEFVARHGFRGFRDRGIGVRREILDTILVERARAAGVHVVEGARVDQLLRDAQGRVNGVHVQTEDGGVDVCAQLVVGADGLRSVVSRRLGLAHSARWPRRFALVTHYRGVAEMSSLGEMHVARDGYVGLAQVGDGIGDDVTNVALVVPARDATMMSGNAEAFLAQWLDRHPALAARFASAERVSPVRATGPFASHAKRPWAPGAALVGDAADFYDPFTGEGIFAALLGGEMLAPFAVDAVHASARADFTRERAALRAYARARRARFAGKGRIERLIGAAVAMPALMNVAARVLGRDRELSDLIIGVTGDFVPPSAMLAPRTIARLSLAVLRHAVRPHDTDTIPSLASAPIPGHVYRS